MLCVLIYASFSTQGTQYVRSALLRLMKSDTPMIIRVRLVDGKTFMLDVAPTDTLAKVVEYMCTQLNIPNKDAKIVYKMKKVPLSTKISDLNLNEDSFLIFHAPMSKGKPEQPPAKEQTPAPPPKVIEPTPPPKKREPLPECPPVTFYTQEFKDIQKTYRDLVTNPQNTTERIGQNIKAIDPSLYPRFQQNPERVLALLGGRLPSSSALYGFIPKPNEKVPYEPLLPSGLIRPEIRRLYIASGRNVQAVWNEVQKTGISMPPTAGV